MLTIYGDYRALKPENELPRLFSQKAYAGVRELRIVPVVYFEALALAAFFPILWRRSESGMMELVALRSIGLTAPPLAEVALPLILRSYPMRKYVGERAEFVPCMDLTPADQADNVGAPVFDASNDFTTAARQRIRSLFLFDRNMADTEAMGRTLVERDMLMEWDLKTRVKEAADLEGDFFALKTAATIPSTFGFLERHQQKGANLMVAHRLSMYRTGTLLRGTGKAKATGS